MADTTTQTQDTPVQFASIPAMTQTQATAPVNPRAGNGAIVAPLPVVPATSVGPGGRITASGSQGPGVVSPLMQFIASLRANSAAQAAPDPNDLRGAPLDQQAAAIAKAGGYQQQKQYDDPAGVAALAAVHNIPTNTAGAIHEPQNHSLDEFLKATDGIPWGKLKQIVAMRHVLTPQEQAQQQYLTELQSGGDPSAYAKGLSALAFFNPMAGALGAPIPAAPDQQGLAAMINQLRGQQPTQ